MREVGKGGWESWQSVLQENADYVTMSERQSGLDTSYQQLHAATYTACKARDQGDMYRKRVILSGASNDELAQTLKNIPKVTHCNTQGSLITCCQ